MPPDPIFLYILELGHNFTFGGVPLEFQKRINIGVLSKFFLATTVL